MTATYKLGIICLVLGALNGLHLASIVLWIVAYDLISYSPGSLESWFKMRSKQFNHWVEKKG